MMRRVIVVSAVLALAACASAKDLLLDDFNGYYLDGIEGSWDRAFPNGTFWEENTTLISPPKAQKFAIYVGEAAIPGDTGLWWGSGWDGLNLKTWATDLDPTKPWSLSCNVYGHNDGRNPGEPPGCWWCEFQVLSFSGVDWQSYGRVFFDASNDRTWEQMTYETSGSTSGDHVITLVMAIHWGQEAGPETFESYVIFDDLILTYTPVTGDGTPPGPVSALSAKRWDGALELFWAAPSDADYAGTLLRYRTDHHPVSYTDGELAGDVAGLPGEAHALLHDGLTNGVTYYYTAYAYDAAGNRAAPVLFSSSPHPGLVSPPGFLPSGWQMIGSPRDTAVPWADCSFTDGAETKRVPDAIAAGWVDAFAYYYEGGYRVLSVLPGYDDDALRPWHGYWLLLSRPGLELVVPAP